MLEEAAPSNRPEDDVAMEIVGTCLNCFSPPGCLLVNSGTAVAVLGFLICRARFGGFAARQGRAK